MGTSSTARSASSTGLWTTIANWFRGKPAAVAQVAPDAPSPEMPAAASEHPAHLIAPGGYQVRVRCQTDVPDNVRQMLPEVQKDLNQIPPLPRVVAELLREIQNPNATAASVAEVLSSDPALAATLLRMVNSAACGLSRKVTSIPDAISYLGFGVVKSLVLRLRLGDVLPTDQQSAHAVRELWVHALAVSYIADVLAETAGGIDRGFASTLALLHDIGKLALLARFPERAKQLEELPAIDKDDRRAREARLFGADHASIGASLALRWKLPADLVTAIRWHHCPARAFGPADPPALARAVAIVQVANQLAKFCYSYSDTMEIDAVAPESLASLGLPGSMQQLLTPRVQAAASRAVLMGGECADASIASHRLIVLHEGEAATRLLERMTAAPLATAVQSSDDLGHRVDQAIRSHDPLFERKLTSSSAPERHGLIQSLETHLTDLHFPSDRRQSTAMILSAILSNFEGHSSASVVLWKEGDLVYLAIQARWLRFDRRFGAAALATSLAALEAELASVINLGWLRRAQTDATGEHLLLELPLKA